ncbi:MAG: GMC family oxidoreductase [Myxococcota bacterium]
MASEEFDACVIGTGAGGAVACQVLCEAGLRVVALQRGPEIEPSQLDEDELATILRDASFSPDQVETYRLDATRPAVAGRYNQMAHAVGGSMIRWSGWSWRFRPDDFRVLSTEGALAGAALADWPFAYEELAPFYERAERALGVSGVAGANPFESPRTGPYPNPPHSPRSSSLAFARGAAAHGLHAFPLPVAINPQPFDGRTACTRGGACQGFGCPIHARASSVSVFLPRARATGRLDLRAGAEVVEIPVGADGRATGARYLDDAGALHEVRARRVVLAGNAVGSARLLLMSTSGAFPHGLANSSGLVGRHLMLHHHAVVRFRTSEPTRSVTGIEAYRAVDDWHPSDASRGFVRGGVVAEVNSFTRQPLVFAFGADGLPGLERAWGERFVDYLEEMPFTVVLGSVLEDLPMADNRIDLDPDVRDARGLPAARITHRQHGNDIAMSRWYRERLLELAEACGAETRSPILIPGPGYTDEDTAMKGSAHLHGTCRMGSDPDASVVDGFGRAHDVPNLWVVDGAVFPTSGGYNPTLTIVANALRTCEHIAAAARRRDA